MIEKEMFFRAKNRSIPLDLNQRSTSPRAGIRCAFRENVFVTEVKVMTSMVSVSSVRSHLG